MTNQRKQEYTLRISQANRSQLIVILYEMILENIEEARKLKEQQNKEEFKQIMQKLRGCINELIDSLDFKYDMANNLYQLYAYSTRELAHADYKFSIEPLNSIQMIMEELKEAFEEVSKQDTSEPVMENSQTVYAGLTYGKNILNENLTHQGVDRGFLA